MADLSAILQELYRRIDTLPPDKAAIVLELGKRFNIGKAAAQSRASVLNRIGASMDDSQKSMLTIPADPGFGMPMTFDANNKPVIAPLTRHEPTGPIEQGVNNMLVKGSRIGTPGQRASGAANILQGAGQIGSVALPGAVAEAPATTALALGGGYAGGKWLKGVSELLGAEPEHTNEPYGQVQGGGADVAEDLGNLLFGTAATRAPNMMSRFGDTPDTQYFMPPRPVTPGGGVSPEARMATVQVLRHNPFVPSWIAHLSSKGAEMMLKPRLPSEVTPSVPPPIAGAVNKSWMANVRPSNVDFPAPIQPDADLTPIPTPLRRTNWFERSALRPPPVQRPQRAEPAWMKIPTAAPEDVSPPTPEDLANSIPLQTEIPWASRNQNRNVPPPDITPPVVDQRVPVWANLPESSTAAPEDVSPIAPLDKPWLTRKTIQPVPTPVPSPEPTPPPPNPVMPQPQPVASAPVPPPTPETGTPAPGQNLLDPNHETVRRVQRGVPNKANAIMDWMDRNPTIVPKGSPATDEILNRINSDEVLQHGKNIGLLPQKQKEFGSMLKRDGIPNPNWDGKHPDDRWIQTPSSVYQTLVKEGYITPQNPSTPVPPPIAPPTPQTVPPPDLTSKLQGSLNQVGQKFAPEVEKAYLKLANGNYNTRILLKDLRPELLKMGLNPTQQDAAFEQLMRNQQANLFNENDPMAVTPEDEAAAYHIPLVAPRHLISLTRPK